MRSRHSKSSTPIERNDARRRSEALRRRSASCIPALRFARMAMAQFLTGFARSAEGRSPTALHGSLSLNYRFSGEIRTGTTSAHGYRAGFAGSP